MLGLFGIFGRSQEIQRLDRAFRAAGLHPRIVADAVKIAMAKQLKEARSGAPDPVTEAAELIAYCALGQREFALNNGAERTEAVEQRMERAIEAGQGLDARLILLTLHAKLTHPSVIDRYDLAAD